ncbi:MAG TPA: hypothetical protein VMT22_02520 [Terriglobales bacterium]|jgi:hypothetical protein|nr:hypothetical protein [Terriglobales bacterium]
MRTTILAFNLDSTKLFEPDALMADQYYATMRKSQHADPELRLMAAILEDAVSCLAKDPRRCARPHRKASEEALSWINAQDEEDWVFSFDNVCETLGLDPGYVRRGLHHWTSRARNATVEAPLRLKKYRSGPRRKKLRFRTSL